MPFDVFYKAMQDGASTKTSQVNADEFEEYFEGFLKQGKDPPGVINSANVAKAELEEKYPDRKMDSLGASSGYGLFMDKLADLRDEGRPIEEVHAWAGGTQAEPASLVFFHRPYVLYQRRPYFQGQRLFRHDAEYLSASEYG